MEKPTSIQVILEKSDVKRLKQLALDRDSNVSEMIREVVKNTLLKNDDKTAIN